MLVQKLEKVLKRVELVGLGGQERTRSGKVCFVVHVQARSGTNIRASTSSPAVARFPQTSQQTQHTLLSLLPPEAHCHLPSSSPSHPLLPPRPPTTTSASKDHWLSFILNGDPFSSALHVRSPMLHVYVGPMEREHTPAVTQTAFPLARLRWDAMERMGRGVWRMEE
ncbi:hypothetical protein BDQ17DRAFT_1436324 [Cyathus striatus]|nr:hypothetical protein BDQ17DRAFT_1436324 [Cyathus striatus]